MVQWAGSPLNQSQAHPVVTRWDEIMQHLSPPGAGVDGVRPESGDEIPVEA